MDERAAQFIEAASVPTDADHGSGDLTEAERILAQHPDLPSKSIYVAAILADEGNVRRLIAESPAAAAARDSPRGWDALTHLCFSRYLRLDRARTQAFVRTARALLEAGASANTGWTDMIDHPNPRPVLESAIYGAAGIAQNADLTSLLLEWGADPNDEETPYHVPETYDNAVLRVLLASPRLNGESRATMLIRKADWHDIEGMRLVLQSGGDPNAITRWGITALHQTLRRDNGLEMVELLLNYGADPRIPNAHYGGSAIAIAARRGRGDVLQLFEQRGVMSPADDLNGLIAICAKGDAAAVSSHPLSGEVRALGGILLPQFAGNGNVQGLQSLLALRIGVDVLYPGDAYFDIAPDSTALHVAAWRAWHDAVEFLIEQGANVHARDGKGRTPVQLAVKACVDSYWMRRRSPRSVAALLRAGSSPEGVTVPSGYDEVDALLIKKQA